MQQSDRLRADAFWREMPDGRRLAHFQQRTVDALSARTLTASYPMSWQDQETGLGALYHVHMGCKLLSDHLLAGGVGLCRKCRAAAARGEADASPLALSARAVTPLLNGAPAWGRWPLFVGRGVLVVITHVPCRRSAKTHASLEVLLAGLSRLAGRGHARRAARDTALDLWRADLAAGAAGAAERGGGWPLAARAAGGAPAARADQLAGAGWDSRWAGRR